MKTLTEKNVSLAKEVSFFQQEAAKFKSKQALSKVKLASVAGQIALVKQEQQKEISMLVEEVERLQSENAGLKKAMARSNSEDSLQSPGLKESQIENAYDLGDMQDCMLTNYLSVRDDDQDRILHRSQSIGPESLFFKTLEISPATVQPISLEARDMSPYSYREMSPGSQRDKHSPDISNYQSNNYASVVTSDISGLQFNKEFQDQFELHSKQMMENYERALETSNSIVESLQSALKQVKHKLHICEASLSELNSKLTSVQNENGHLLEQLTREKFEHAKVLNNLSKYIAQEKQTQRRSTNLDSLIETEKPSSKQKWADTGSSSSSKDTKSSGFFTRFF